MKQKNPLTLLLLFSLHVLFSCDKENADIPKEPKPPIAQAGNDTTIFLPFNSAELNGAGLDSEYKIILYQWKVLSGPSPVGIGYSSNSGQAHIDGLEELGDYTFEFTVKNSQNLIAKDSVKVTVAEPRCTGSTKEIVLQDQVWDAAWWTLNIDNFFSYLPPNSYLKNIYIKRDASTNWDKVPPNSSIGQGNTQVYFWSYTGTTLFISIISGTIDDTPDIKIEYCN